LDATPEGLFVDIAESCPIPEYLGIRFTLVGEEK
jgi:hypothetical protein